MGLGGHVDDRDVEQTKSALARALRRRAAELDKAVEPVDRRFASQVLSPAPERRGRVARGPRARPDRTAFFARDAFRDVALRTPVGSGVHQ
jgi:hypothetical protein